MADPERRECAKCRRQFAAKMAVCPFCGHRGAAASPTAGAAPTQAPPAPPGPVSFAAEAEQMSPMLRLMAILPNFTPASLTAVDAFLDQVWGGRDGAKRETDRARWAPLIRQVGCYVGEVVRRTCGGHWQRDPRDPSRGQVVLPDGLAADPFSHAELRFDVGWSHSLASQFDVLRTMIAMKRRGIPIPAGGVGLAGAPPADPAEAVHWTEQADSFQVSGRPDLAMPFYDKAIELVPGSGAGWFGKGNCHAFLGRFADALPCFDRAVELTPDFAEAWENRACTLMELDRLDEAERCLDKLLALAPGRASVFYNRGNLFRRRGRAAEALAAWEQALALDPGFRGARGSQAGLLEELGRFADAVTCHERALALDPQDGQAWLDKARCLERLERWPEALDGYAEAVRLDPRSAGGWHRKARLEDRLGRKLDAIASLETLIGLAPPGDPALVADARQRLDALERDPARWAAEASARAQAGQIEAALACYDKVVGLDPGRVGAWRERGVGLALLRRFPEALASFDHALEIEPRDVTTLDHKGVTLARMGRADEALPLIDRALSLGPRKGSLLKHRATCLEALGRPEEALATYEEALAAEPGIAQLWLLRAAVEHRLGRSRDATASLQQFVAAAPPDVADVVEAARRQLATGDDRLWHALDPGHAGRENARASYDRGLAHAREGRFAEALPCFEEATRLDPGNRTFWKDRGLTLMELEQDAEAIRCLEKCIDLDRCSAEPYYSKGRAEERLGRREEASRSYRMFLVLGWPVDREFADYARQRLREWGVPELDLADTGLFDEFMSLHLKVGKGLGLSEGSADLWIVLGEQFDTSGRPDLALHCYEKVLALRPTELKAWLGTGRMLAERGRVEEALARFTRVVELQPDHAYGWWYKQIAEERLGRRADRRASLECYLAVAPPDQRQLIEKARELLTTLAR